MEGLIFTKKAAKSLLVLVSAFSLLALLVTQGLAAGAPGKINYVAFGDSVSAGVRGGVGTPGSEPGSDKGYTDDIAGLLKSADVLGNFNKDFCVSGMTAKVLAQNTAVLLDATASGAIMVKNADIVTLDVGANDLLVPLYAYIATLKSVTDFDKDKAIQILNQMINDLHNGTTGTDIQRNIETILHNVLTANGNVKIFVMGYYNPLPAVSSMLGVDLNAPTAYFNTLIQKAISNVQAKYPKASISYVDTFTAMAATSNGLVATDIHPTEAGYTVIAGEFWKQIKPLSGVCRADAAVSTSTFNVNGLTVPFGAYSINNNNYIKLRDVAMALNGTPKQISVTWDSSTDVVTITSTKPYSPVGGELSLLKSSGVIKALLSKSTLVMDGNALNLTVYNIEGNNYIKLRDLAAAFNIGVSWESGTNTVSIDVTKSYIPPAA